MKEDEREELLEELKKEFSGIKKRLGLRCSFEEFDDAFFISDFVIDKGYLPKSLERSMRLRINDSFSNWVSYLHSLVVPNPSSMISISQNRVFKDEDKKKVAKTISRLMASQSKNIAIDLNGKEDGFAGFVDEAVSLWKSVKKDISSYAKALCEYWEKESV
jgi:hypothetical protein